MASEAPIHARNLTLVASPPASVAGEATRKKRMTLCCCFFCAAQLSSTPLVGGFLSLKLECVSEKQHKGDIVSTECLKPKKTSAKRRNLRVSRSRRDEMKHGKTKNKERCSLLCCYNRVSQTGTKRPRMWVPAGGEKRVQKKGLFFSSRRPCSKFDVCLRIWNGFSDDSGIPICVWKLSLKTADGNQNLQKKACKSVYILLAGA